MDALSWGAKTLAEASFSPRWPDADATFFLLRPARANLSEIPQSSHRRGRGASPASRHAARRTTRSFTQPHLCAASRPEVAACNVRCQGHNTVNATSPSDSKNARGGRFAPRGGGMLLAAPWRKRPPACRLAAPFPLLRRFFCRLFPLAYRARFSTPLHVAEFLTLLRFEDGLELARTSAVDRSSFLGRHPVRAAASPVRR